ncbi:MerR family transcriptional regulator [Nonomuraea typhae]|uniref:MerR family transcriptional regulator n=1 Tax=Nonomuraea typhae TaxID=2603600 RepID=UPI0012F778B5|nr:MerR family transcriptional regulator [Nonomuraea typhae]
MSEHMLTIGELADRAGVATSALRYWDELGLLPAPVRVSGQRRYPESALALVGAVLLLRDAGFSLAEQKALMATRGGAREEWDRLARRKLAELDEQIAKARAAREAIEHGLRCGRDDLLGCPNFNGLVTARLAGQPLQDAHEHCAGHGG